MPACWSFLYRLINEAVFPSSFSKNGQIQVVVVVAAAAPSTFCESGVWAREKELTELTFFFLSEKEGHKIIISLKAHLYIFLQNFQCIHLHFLLLQFLVNFLS